MFLCNSFVSMLKCAALLEIKARESMQIGDFLCLSKFLHCSCHGVAVGSSKMSQGQRVPISVESAFIISDNKKR